MRKLFFALFLSISSLSAHVENANTRLDDYVPQLRNKRVAVVANAGSVIGQIHLVDALIARGVQVQKIFALEHGFRGTGDAGELISDSIDARTGLPIVSLYGSAKKPTAAMLRDVDSIVFDIQDVGVRFFTYISSLGLIMEAAAENGKEVIVLDRPNPNADYIAGPVLDMKYESFVGAFPIPIVYGMTIGELALMIKGEGWIKSARPLRLLVVPMKSYDRNIPVYPTISPSPNLPTPLSIRLYPSLALFEATTMSVGRGTRFPFEVVGNPDPRYGDYVFTPKSIVGMATNPPHLNRDCYGERVFESDYSDLTDIKFSLDYFNKFYERSGHSSSFINSRSFFHLLLGRDDLYVAREKRFEVQARHNQQIREFKQKRGRYLIYP